ncbi:sensor histidine kinase [Paractinoplanes brasiliensis]|uniref:histidine kinase n=1 Tax=Paractinoplanes brasiliensis TaxID=52695 RepID=A0A4R6JTI4_9ACTN|nr:nitrate- and nitrite sensing domain-containing protein [Actinoplanes brasiliensis]TDO38761.1 signal transduction histidine kinase [Actinoplanes brasiliensis]GID26461.1 histidine kinase [Actinoplanes brasiliensis]
MSTGSSTQVTRRGVFPRLRDARIRAKLGLILVVPLVAVIALATTRLVDVGQRAADAGQVEELTKLETDVSALTQLLHIERMAAAAFLGNRVSDERTQAYRAAVRASDAQIQVYRAHRNDIGEPPATVKARLVRIDDHLNTMDATRSAVGDRNGIAVAEAVSRYTVVITDLVSYGEAVSQFAGDGDIADRLRAIAAFARAKAGTADQEAVSYAAVVTRDLSAEQRVTFIATQTAQQEALLAFSLVASPEQTTLVDNVVSGDAVNLVDGVSAQLSRAGNGGVTDPDEVTRTFGSVVDLMRWAEQELESDVVDLASSERDAVVRQTAIEAALVLLVLIVAIALAVILARSLNMSLRRLREGALAVANRDLPDAVAMLRDARNLGEGGADELVRQVRDPIQLPNRDEVGQVAQAFNVVHREAVRIAAEQAALRTSVSTMFLNLARRSQSLVDRMIGELDQIERTEEDPKRLAQLFELDHLATRMRRNDENLLVLAGADSSAPRREDALLVDALRAAQSEVELYNRIEFGTVDTDISIAALAVNDVVRLVAELLDNATRFSPPTTIVVADGRRIRDYVVIQVEDRGLGMSEEQMDQLNRRLAEPPNVDVAAFRLMGLAVVGRLASRYGIRVELRANLEGGTVAQVTLPSSIVVLPSRRLDAPVRPQELGTAPYGSDGWDARSSRAATATLPTISSAPEPAWREPTPPPPAAHPQLPMFPSQRPPSDPDTQPTPNRPPLPTRVTKTIDATNSSTTMNGFAAATPASPASAQPVSAQPASAPPAPTGNGWGAALAAMPPPPPPPVAPSAEDRSDAPIFVQMQQSWFRNHENTSEEWGMPTAGYAPPPNGSPAKPAAAAQASPAPAPAPAKAAPAPVAAPPPPTPSAASKGHNGPSVPKPRAAAEDRWKTSADEGWQKAMAAAEPVDAGTTRSGLPKRVPQAQLVPGGVQPGPKNQNRRSPDEVRGLLSAYHRGVQRGRTDGTAESAASQAKENQP